MSVVTDTQHIRLGVRIQTHPDRPGIARVAVGDQVVFEGDAEMVTDATVRLVVPFHIHFEDIRIGMAWKEKDL